MPNQIDYMIRKAIDTDLDEIKKIADSHKKELGFIMRPVLARSITAEELMVVINGVGIMGFIQYHHRRDEQTTLHNIVVVSSFRRYGVGRKLIQSLENEAVSKNKSFVLLKCPEDLNANVFYEHVGYKKIDNLIGKSRRLNIWTKMVG